MIIKHTIGTHEISDESYERFFAQSAKHDPIILYSWMQDYLKQKGLSYVNITYRGAVLAKITRKAMAPPPDVRDLVDDFGGSLLAIEYGTGR